MVSGDKAKSSMPRIKDETITTIEYLSVHELKPLLIETQKMVEGFSETSFVTAPEINDLINYVATFLKLFDGKSLDPEEAKELRERLKKEFGLPDKYAALIVSHLPVTEDELSELLPRHVLSELKPEDLRKISERMKKVVKERF